MTTQKTFKRRVRARAAKTGESYTAARTQLLRHSEAPDEPPQPEPIEVRQLAGVSDDAIVRGSGRPLAEWLELLDAWGAPDRRHADIAAWLQAEHAVPGWYAQTITVAYERARGMRAKHQNAGGFAIGARRTVRTDVATAIEAFTDASLRDRWLPDVSMRPRRTTSTGAARFDWADPPSRLVVGVAETAPGKVQVAVSHERLPDSETAERVKSMWRGRLAALKQLLEGG